MRLWVETSWFSRWWVSQVLALCDSQLWELLFSILSVFFFCLILLIECVLFVWARDFRPFVSNYADNACHILQVHSTSAAQMLRLLYPTIIPKLTYHFLIVTILFPLESRILRMLFDMHINLLLCPLICVCSLLLDLLRRWFMQQNVGSHAHLWMWGGLLQLVQFHCFPMLQRM